MSLYTRARKHIDMGRVKELHETKILVQQLIEHRQQIIDELDEINRHNKHVDWKEEIALKESMTTGGLLQSYLPAMGDVALDRISSVTVNDADNLEPYQDYPPPDYAITAQDQSLGRIDVTKYDTLKLTISGSFNTRTVDGHQLSDGIWIGVLINGTYAGNYLAQDLRAGTHVIPIPARFQKPNMRFGAIKVYAIQGVSTPTSITNIQLQRRTPKTVFVGLDDPEANSFIRDGQADKLSPAEKKKKLEEQLRNSEEYLNKMFGSGMPKGATELLDVQPQQSFMDIQVGDQRVTKVNNRTVTDTTRGIRDGKMDGRPTYTDRQGNLRVSQPQPQLKPQPQPKSTTTTTTTTSDTDRTSITNVPTTSTYTPYTDAEKLEKDFSTNPNLLGRGIRSATDQARFSGDKMFQGNPSGRAPGLSNYWSPEPKTAATYSNPGAGKGIPGTGPNPTGTITTAQRPPGTPRVTRGITGTPQFKFPAGSPPPSNMLTQMADDAAVSVANKAAATSASKVLSRAVPVVSIGIAVADATVRASNGDYAGAVLSGLSAVPGPVGWAGLGVQIATDAAGFTGGVKEQQEFDNYGDYIKGAGKIAKKNKIKIDRNAMLDLFLRELSKNNKLSDKDKEFLVAIFTDAEGLEKDDVITFVKKIQKKLTNENSIKEQVLTEKKRLKSPTSVVDKIPGYYDGKPSPLGFPIEEPPKMKNGFHPDLVDGKKVSQRYNRLDPISANSMPKTGNPHIDKKVKKAQDSVQRVRKLKNLVGSQVNEAMTTAGMGMVNYEPHGDVNLATVSNSVSSTGSNPTASGSNGNYNFGDVAQGALGSSISLNGTIDVTQYDTLKFNFQAGNIDTFYAVTSSGQQYNFSTSSGTKVLKFNSIDRSRKTIQMAFHVQRGGSSNLPVGNNYIRNLSYQRRAPINVVVPLDDPKANSFIRGGLGGDQNKRKQLKDMLDAGNKLMVKMGLTPSRTSPGDIKLAGYGLRPDGTQGLSMPGDIVPDHNGNPMKLVPDPSRGRGFNRWVPVKKA